MDNGILQVTLSKPGGIITGIKYNGVDNVLEVRNKETNRGYVCMYDSCFDSLYWVCCFLRWRGQVYLNV